MWFLFALASAVAKGLLIVFDKKMLSDPNLDPLSLSTVRGVTNTITVAIVILLMVELQDITMTEETIKYAIDAGFLLALASVFYFSAVSKGTASIVAPLLHTDILVITAISVFILGETINPLFYPAMLAILIGSISVAQTNGKGFVIDKSIIFVAITILFNAMLFFPLAQGSKTTNPIFFVFLMSSVNMIFRAAIFLHTKSKTLLNQVKKHTNMVIITSILSMAEFAFAATALTMIEVPFVVAVKETSPLFTLLVAAFILNEKVTKKQRNGALTIAAGTIIIALIG